MPNNGPSRACQVCKSRKVKCDETEPSCQRCIRSGVQCPGYPQEWDIVFRDMTGIAERQVRSRAESSRGSNLRISPPVPTDWKAVAVPRFLANYVCPSKTLADCDLRFLPELCSGPNVSEMLKEALDAVAWLNLSNQHGMEWLTVEAQLSYIKAVGHLRELLQDEVEAKKDTTLAANFLFGLFEHISGFKYSGGRWSANRHMPGRTSLLRLRGANQFSTQLGRNLFRLSYASITVKCIHDHARPADEAESWLDDFSPSVHDPQIELARCNLRSARLCFDAQSLVERKSEDIEWILDLLRIIKEAILIDASYQKWEESQIESWRPRNVRRSGATRPMAMAETQQVYEDVQTSGTWNNYRAVRIHLNEVLLRCCEFATSHVYAVALDLDFSETEIQCHAIISELVSELCASVPFCLGEVDSSGNPKSGAEVGMALGGYLLLFPFSVARSSCKDDEERMEWFNEKLRFVSQVMGIQMAQTILDQPVKDPWDLSCLKPERMAM